MGKNATDFQQYKHFYYSLSSLWIWLCCLVAGCHPRSCFVASCMSSVAPSCGSSLGVQSSLWTTLREEVPSVRHIGTVQIWLRTDHMVSNITGPSQTPEYHIQTGNMCKGENKGQRNQNVNIQLILVSQSS